MEAQRLIELRKKQIIEFSTLKELLAITKDLFGNPNKVPIVVGDDSPHNRCPMEVNYLSPYRESDEITLRNFLDGIDELSQYKAYNTIRSELYFFNTSTPRTEPGFMDLNFGTPHSLRYVLNLQWREPWTYRAVASTSESEVDKIMQRHIGPNK